MPASKPRLGAGDVEIVLDGETRILKPSLRAALTLSRAAGGLLGMMERVDRLDLDAVTAVTAAGLDLTERGAEGLAEKVWRTGLGFNHGLVTPIRTFLQTLANGGRPLEEAKAEEENPPKPSS